MPSTSARRAARLAGRAAGALALVCLALGPGRAPAQDDFGPARPPALPSPLAEPPPLIPIPPSAAAGSPEADLPASHPACPPDKGPAHDDFGPARPTAPASPLTAPPPQLPGASVPPAPGAEPVRPASAPRPADRAEWAPARRNTGSPGVPARPAPVADRALRLAALQQPLSPPGAPGELTPTEETGAYRIQLEPPGPERLFRLDSEARLQERIRQEGLDRTPVDIAVFPTEPVLSTQPYYGRRWPAAHEFAEANYVCYRRLLYEQKNFERYGWDLGFITPVVSGLDFFADFILMPYHGFTDVCRCYECSAGYCLPGDPVPLVLYPCEPSVTGALAEAGAVAAVLAIFP